jgi:hypothetical protein
MRISRRATTGHLIAGIVLVILSLTALFVGLLLEVKAAALLVFFFGVWGGVELGRYLEYSLNRTSSQ